MGASDSLVPPERIEHSILLIRGRKVMLDADLAELYQVDTRVLVQAVKRNLERFPDDFMFQLAEKEFRILTSQSGATTKWGGRRYPPFAFTEQGIAMLSTVLRSQRAIRVNIEIMRAFVRLRRMLASQISLASKLKALERKYDSQFRVVFEVLHQMTESTSPKRHRIGFLADPTTR